MWLLRTLEVTNNLLCGYLFAIRTFTVEYLSIFMKVNFPLWIVDAQSNGDAMWGNDGAVCEVLLPSSGGRRNDSFWCALWTHDLLFRPFQKKDFSSETVFDQNVNVKVLLLYSIFLSYRFCQMSKFKSLKLSIKKFSTATCAAYITYLLSYVQCCMWQTHILYFVAHMVFVHERSCYNITPFKTGSALYFRPFCYFACWQVRWNTAWHIKRYSQPVPGRSEWDAPAAPLSQPSSSHTAGSPAPSQLSLVAHKLTQKRSEDKQKEA